MTTKLSKGIEWKLEEDNGVAVGRGEAKTMKESERGNWQIKQMLTTCPCIGRAPSFLTGNTTLRLPGKCVNEIPAHFHIIPKFCHDSIWLTAWLNTVISEFMSLCCPWILKQRGVLIPPLVELSSFKNMQSWRVEIL